MSEILKLKRKVRSQNPTKEQENAIFNPDLEFILRASPGSGKTWTSCRRFLWRGLNSKADLGGIALLSFTNTAIKEFYEATSQVGHRNLLSDPNYVGTFDAFIERFIITPFGHLVTSKKERPRLLETPLKGFWSNNNLKYWYTGKTKKYPIHAWDIIPFLEEKKLKFKTKIVKELDEQAQAPMKHFLDLGYYTHGQRIYLACWILSQIPSIGKCLARRFPEIIIDEAQDTNEWLLYFLHTLREHGCKVTLIGDPDQCIYEFSMADPNSLIRRKDQWKLQELPLSKSFRCNKNIAKCVRELSNNSIFEGTEQIDNEYCKAYVYREPDSETFTESINEFEKLVKNASISIDDSTILCRGHKQLKQIKGDDSYSKLTGKAKDIATATFHRDSNNDYSKAFDMIIKVFKEISDDDQFWEKYEGVEHEKHTCLIKQAVWKFIKSKTRLPSIECGGEIWIEHIKGELEELFKELKINNIPKFGQKIQKRGLNTEQLALPLFSPHSELPNIRQETIHKVKGESIDAVLLIGSSTFFNKAVSSSLSKKDCEDKRLAYVAMTRARHCLMIALPSEHYDKHINTWLGWGFKVFKS